MQEITEKLRRKVLSDLEPLAEKLAQEGKDENEIVSILQRQINLKVQYLYEKENRSPKQLGEILGTVFSTIKPDSKAETIFYKMLIESGLKFEFQYDIGPYRADYLFGGFLVVELDGPQHEKERDEKRDKYMKKMGYKVIRIPIWILASCPEAVVDEIKENLYV